MWPQVARTVSTSLVQQMVHSNALSMCSSRRSRRSASAVALANAAWATRASSSSGEKHRRCGIRGVVSYVHVQDKARPVSSRVDPTRHAKRNNATCRALTTVDTSLSPGGREECIRAMQTQNVLKQAVNQLAHFMQQGTWQATRCSCLIGLSTHQKSAKRPSG